MNNRISIFLVDDDHLYLKLLQIEFEKYENYDISLFDTGELCVQNLGKKPDIIVLDYFLNGVNKAAMNGLETLDLIKKFNLDIPVVILSAQDKIDIAVKCMHHGALDYVVKSETAFLQLQKSIKSIISFKKLQTELDWYMKRM